MEAFATNDAGRSVIVRSLRGPEVFAQLREQVPRPGASLLKLALVGAVHSAAAAGGLDLSEPIERRRLRPTVYASALDALEPEHQLSLGELCALCLITSDNPVAEHLLDAVGIDQVNRYLSDIGCRDTHMRVGFDDHHLGAAGRANVTTAADALLLVCHLVQSHPPIAEALTSNLRNTRIPLRLSPEVRVAHKTGTLPGVAHDVGVVFGQGTDLAMAFLCEGQLDTARTSIEIGDCVARMWAALGERTGAPPDVLTPPGAAAGGSISPESRPSPAARGHA